MATTGNNHLAQLENWEDFANGQRGNCDRAHHFNISISSLFGGLILWYRGSVEKRYAAERAFNHLKRNYEQLTANLTTLGQQEDDRFDGIRLRLNNIEQDVQRMHPQITPLAGELPACSLGFQLWIQAAIGILQNCTVGKEIGQEKGTNAVPFQPFTAR